MDRRPCGIAGYCFLVHLSIYSWLLCRWFPKCQRSHSRSPFHTADLWAWKTLWIKDSKIIVWCHWNVKWYMNCNIWALICTANNFEIMYSRQRISQNSLSKFIYVFPKSFMIFQQELLDAAFSLWGNIVTKGIMKQIWACAWDRTGAPNDVIVKNNKVRALDSDSGGQHQNWVLSCRTIRARYF